MHERLAIICHDARICPDSGNPSSPRRSAHYMSLHSWYCERNRCQGPPSTHGSILSCRTSRRASSFFLSSLSHYFPAVPWVEVYVRSCLKSVHYVQSILVPSYPLSASHFSTSIGYLVWMTSTKGINVIDSPYPAFATDTHMGRHVSTSRTMWILYPCTNISLYEYRHVHQSHLSYRFRFLSGVYGLAVSPV